MTDPLRHPDVALIAPARSPRAAQRRYIGVAFKVNVLDSTDLRQSIEDYTNRPTISQIYVEGEFVGGSDIVKEMFQSGELKRCWPTGAIA